MKIIRLAAVAAAALLAMPAAAQEKLSLSHWVPPNHAMQPTGLVPWAESIKKASNGELEVEIYPAQQLGAAPDHYDMARDGIADITYVNPGYQPGRFPIVALGEMPFHVTNAIEGSQAFDEWYREYAAKEMPDVYFCVAFFHDPGSLHSKGPMRVPADIKGKNIRPAQATMARLVSMLGGSSLQVSAPETRDLLATGAADAVTFPWDGLYLFGMDTVVKHHIDMPFYATTFVYVMNKARYEGLSEQNRKVIDDHCTSEWAMKLAEGWAKVEMAGRERIKAAPDHTVYKPTPEELQLWKDAAAPLLDAWKKDVAAKGDDPDAIYARFRDVLAKHNSLIE